MLFTNLNTRALYSCTVGSFCMHVAGNVLKMMRMSNVQFLICVVFHNTSFPLEQQHVPCMLHASLLCASTANAWQVVSMEWSRIACQEVSMDRPRIRAQLQCREGDRALSISPVLRRDRLMARAPRSRVAQAQASAQCLPLRASPDNPARCKLAC